MRAVSRREYRKVRKEFKTDMWSLAKTNKASVIMIIETYVAMRNLAFIDWGLYEKYYGRIPEHFAMGDALAVAYRALKYHRDTE